MSAAAVGKKYGVAPTTVTSNLRSRGDSPRAPTYKVIVGAKLEKALELRAQGWSYAKIGRHFGVSATTASDALRQADQA